jgi:hypothetical protein
MKKLDLKFSKRGLKVIALIAIVLIATLGLIISMRERRENLGKEEEVKQKKTAAKELTSLKELLDPPLESELDTDSEIINHPCIKPFQYFLTHSLEDTLKKPTYEIVKDDKCIKFLNKRFKANPALKGILNCLSSPDIFYKRKCTKHIINFRAYAVDQYYVQKVPWSKLVNENEKKEWLGRFSSQILMHKLIWNMESDRAFRKPDLLKNIEFARALGKRLPKMFAPVKAEFVNSVIFDVKYIGGGITSQTFLALDKLFDSGGHEKALYMRGVLEIMKKEKDVKDIEHHAFGPWLEDQSDPEGYYMLAAYYWKIHKNKEEANKWLDTGIRKCTKGVEMLEAAQKRLAAAKPDQEEDVFPFEYHRSLIDF